MSNHPPGTVRLFGIPEAAAALGFDQSTIYRRVERGALVPDAYVGRRPLFSAATLLGIPPADAEAALERRRVEVEADRARHEDRGHE